MLLVSFILWIKHYNLATFFFFFPFQEPEFLAKKFCRPVFLPPWGFYTPAGFLTCCTTTGVVEQFSFCSSLRHPLLQVFIFASGFFVSLL